VSNEYRLFRDAWAEKMGSLLRGQSAWANLSMYQEWDEGGGYRFMLNNRLRQARSGRQIRQVDEEYGYEDRYPVGWGGNRRAPARSTDTRRRIAWEITMAGGHQITGERADTGAG
jgi:hypothetical protein